MTMTLLEQFDAALTAGVMEGLQSHDEHFTSRAFRVVLGMSPDADATEVFDALECSQRVADLVRRGRAAPDDVRLRIFREDSGFIRPDFPKAGQIAAMVGRGVCWGLLDCGPDDEYSFRQVFAALDLDEPEERDGEYDLLRLVERVATLVLRGRQP